MRWPTCVQQKATGRAAASCSCPARAWPDANPETVFAALCSGVALWEIWTFGALPYGELTGREVLEQIEQNVRLDKPDGCPSNVYGTMMKCWAYEREARPTFLKLTKELKSFLTPDMAKHLK